ncbi:MAG: branched-chain amino acid transport system substrate-binding protein [Phormidium sp. OSCR]|nr:MAG: branched-chain amino acid transport system substrate-binding protein [Phormidium sp. OSCR]
MADSNNRVVLKLDGDLECQGFKVFLEIGVGGQLPQIEMMGYLPANPQLAQQLRHHWRDRYRTIGAPYIRSPESFQTDTDAGMTYRIKPKKSFASHRETRFVACQQSAQKLAQDFCQWLMSPGFYRLDLCLREELAKDEEIELLIRCDDGDIKKLPWHLWSFCQRYSRTEVSFGSRVTSRVKTSQPKPTPQVKILAILGHGEDIDTSGDRQFLNQLPQAQVEFLVEPKRQEINAKLWQDSWDIIFFAGHSQTLGDRGKIYINPQESLEIADLSYGFQNAVKQGLTLAIFNSCDGLGLVQKIEDWQIPVAIVMRELVPDKVAQQFLTSFLTQFSQGDSFRTSVRRAREQLQGLEGEFPCASWLPIIYQNCLDLRLAWHSFIAPVETKVFAKSPEVKLSVKSNFSEIAPPITQESSWQNWLKNNPVKLGVLIFSLILGQVWGLPSLANYFNQQGQAEVETPSDVERPWVRAKRWFQLALWFDRNHSAAHVNLGNMYDDLGHIDKAEYHYTRSYNLLNAVGCNNLSRLYIRQGQHERASITLMQCKNLLKKNQPWTEYSIAKNQGWAALEQQSYRLARHYLETAIDLKPNEGAAHCLMAQLPDLEESQFAIHAETCIDNVRDTLPEEVQWKARVQDQLETGEFRR